MRQCTSRVPIPVGLMRRAIAIWALTIPLAAQAQTTSGFHVSNGRIIAPNGQAFKAQGINILEATLGAVVVDQHGGALLKHFPNTNFVRIVAMSGYNSYLDPTFLKAVNWLTAKGIVVEIANFNLPVDDVATGDQLTQEANWFTHLATNYKDNPYVWFGTDNEPEDASAGGKAAKGSVTAEQVAAYNAIRATGNTSIVVLEGATRAILNPAAYTVMTNVIWDDHFYNWTSGYTTDMAALQADFRRVIAPQQTIKSADGIIPIIIGEFGNATDGSKIDHGGPQTVQTVLNEAQKLSGWAAFVYYWPASWGGKGLGDELTIEATGELTAYGQQIAAAMSGNNLQTGGAARTGKLE